MYNKSNIKKAFHEGRLKIKSCSIDGKIEYKVVLNVLKHFTIIKDIYKIILINEKTVIVTEDHNLFILKDNKLESVKPKDKPKEVVFLQNEKLELVKVEKIEKIEKRTFMFDLSIEENHNFFLTNNILVCNSFSPPSSEQTIMGFTRTRGYRWPDETLYFHLVQSTNYINLVPPDTGFTLSNIPAAWQPLVLLQAMIYALWDEAILWINEEFNYSLNGISLDISRSDKYSGAAQALQGQMEAQLANAKKRIHIIRGLAQSKYTFSYGAALGPWVSSKMAIKKWVIGSQSGRGYI